MKILIATDGSDFSKAAVEKACEIIKPGATEVLCFSSYDNAIPAAIDPGFVSADYFQHLTDALNEGAETNVADAEAIIRKHFSPQEVGVTTDVASGIAPDRTIIEKASEWNADLIVVGSHGRGFWGRLLGSVSNAVVHHAPCSVLVVRKPDK